MSIRPASPTESRGLFRRSDATDLRVEGAESLIDSTSAFDGVFRVGTHLRVEGEAKGEILCEGTLTIAEGAIATAKVSAANIIVAGTLTGEVICRERLQILPSGRLSGTVTTGSLAIQEGAFYEGELHMRTTPAETRPQPTAGRVAPSSPPSRSRGAAANGRAEVPADEA